MGVGVNREKKEETERRLIAFYEKALEEGRVRMIPLRLLGKIFGVTAESISRDLQRIENRKISFPIAVARFEGFRRNRGEILHAKDKGSFVKNYIATVDRLVTSLTEANSEKSDNAS